MYVSGWNLCVGWLISDAEVEPIAAEMDISGEKEAPPTGGEIQLPRESLTVQSIKPSSDEHQDAMATGDSSETKENSSGGANKAGKKSKKKKKKDVE